MRIAVICHDQCEPLRIGGEYLVGQLAEVWRAEGHEVEVLTGTERFWPADVAIQHVDLSVVPPAYLEFARRFPIVLNARVTDIRKSRVSRNLLQANSDYPGRVIVKTDLNAAGFREMLCQPTQPPSLPVRVLRKLRRVLLREPPPKLPHVKDYRVYKNLRQVPRAVFRNPALVVEKFLPEETDGLYFTRRCNLLGDRAISTRMGNVDPIGGGFAPVFEWIENSPEVLAFAEAFGLDYGAVDYTEVNGEAAIFDVNKTVGLGALEFEDVRENYSRIARYLASGIEHFVPVRRGSKG